MGIGYQHQLCLTQSMDMFGLGCGRGGLVIIEVMCVLILYTVKYYNVVFLYFMFQSHS